MDLGKGPFAEAACIEMEGARRSMKSPLNAVCADAGERKKNAAGPRWCAEGTKARTIKKGP